MNLQDQATSEEWCACKGNQYGISWAEYQKWAEWMATVEKVPRMLYERPFLWQSRAFLGKWMVSHGRVAEGIGVLRSVIDRQGDADDSYMASGEERAWCLKELGAAVWLFEKNAGAALEYMEQALLEAEAVQGELFHVSRGEVWNDLLVLLEAAGRGREADKSADEVLRDAGDGAGGTSRSYVFFASYHKARQAINLSDMKTAASFMRRGLAEYAEPEYAERASVCLDAGLIEAAWAEFEQMRRESYLVWDDDFRPRTLWQKITAFAGSLGLGEKIARKGACQI